jgi:hypothetical protein
MFLYILNIVVLSQIQMGQTPLVGKDKFLFYFFYI